MLAFDKFDSEGPLSASVNQTPATDPAPLFRRLAIRQFAMGVVTEE